jgi:hypothetical protein
MFSRIPIAFVLFAAFATPCFAQITVDRQTIVEHDDGNFLWFHPRAAIIPDSGGHSVMTLQQHLQKSDYYSGLYVMHSRDFGQTWTQPEAIPELAWRDEPPDVTVAVCDVTPGWHAPTNKLIAIGVKVRYRDGVQVYEKPQSHAAAYAVYDPAADSWSDWKFVDMPDPTGTFYLVTPGCVQWHVRDDGDLLVPMYFRSSDEKAHHATIVHCKFDGETMTYAGHGDELSLDVERGLVEPSLIKFGGRFYLTLRNDVKAYVTSGEDGLRFDPIKPWTFDDGEELGSYNTQAHWLTVGGKLYLVYTRRGADNDHVMRNRAPLFMAEVDPEALHVVRDTEIVVLPERGAAMGNFGVNMINENEAWVTVSEGIWNDDMRQRGATGATFLARVTANTE